MVYPILHFKLDQKQFCQTEVSTPQILHIDKGHWDSVLKTAQAACGKNDILKDGSHRSPNSVAEPLLRLWRVIF
jgi:hypothetical protein